MGLSIQDIEKVIEDKKDYVFCETCKFAVAKEGAYVVGIYSTYESCKKYYCETHTPEYDQVYDYNGEEKKYWKHIPAKRVEVKLKK